MESKLQVSVIPINIKVMLVVVFFYQLARVDSKFSMPFKVIFKSRYCSYVYDQKR